MALPIAAGLAGAAGSIQQGKLAMQNAKRDKEILEARSRSDAKTTLENMRRGREENDSALARIKSRLATNGLMTTSGSSRDFLREAEKRLEMRILDQGQAWSGRDRGNRATAEARMHEGRSRKAAGYARAASGLIGTGAKVARIHNEIADNTTGGAGSPEYWRRAAWF